MSANQRPPGVLSDQSEARHHADLRRMKSNCFNNEAYASKIKSQFILIGMYTNSNSLSFEFSKLNLA